MHLYIITRRQPVPWPQVSLPTFLPQQPTRTLTGLPLTQRQRILPGSETPMLPLTWFRARCLWGLIQGLSRADRPATGPCPFLRRRHASFWLGPAFTKPRPEESLRLWYTLLAQLARSDFLPLKVTGDEAGRV